MHIRQRKISSIKNRRKIALLIVVRSIKILDCTKRIWFWNFFADNTINVLQEKLSVQFTMALKQFNTHNLFHFSWSQIDIRFMRFIDVYCFKVFFIIVIFCSNWRRDHCCLFLAVRVSASDVHKKCFSLQKRCKCINIKRFKQIAHFMRVCRRCVNGKWCMFVCLHRLLSNDRCLFP